MKWSRSLAPLGWPEAISMIVSRRSVCERVLLWASGHGGVHRQPAHALERQRGRRRCGLDLRNLGFLDHLAPARSVFLHHLGQVLRRAAAHLQVLLAILFLDL